MAPRCCGLNRSLDFGLLSYSASAVESIKVLLARGEVSIPLLEMIQEGTEKGSIQLVPGLSYNLRKRPKGDVRANVAVEISGTIARHAGLRESPLRRAAIPAGRS